jgi:type IV pilus assembly protein PilZ
MTETAAPSMRRFLVDFKTRAQFQKFYLSEPTHGGMVVRAPLSLEVGDLVSIRVRMAEDGLVEELRSVILWRRLEPAGLMAGVGFLSSEVEKRERLLRVGKPDPFIRERKSSRFNATLLVTYQTSTDFVVDYVRNISPGGFFVDCQRPLAVGTSILFRLFPPGLDQPIDLPGRVSWQQPTKGFGVSFLRPDLRAQSQIDDLVRRFSVGGSGEGPAPAVQVASVSYPAR